MAKKKEGDLRLLKDGVVFGPTDRAGLGRLLAAGRLTLADHVSVNNADWLSIAEFLAAPAAPAKVEAFAAAGLTVATGRPKKGDLRVLSGGRVVSSLSRSDVEQLHSAGRIGDDDLICALNGPWMTIGDFLSLPPPVEVPAPAATTIAPAPTPVVTPIAPQAPGIVPHLPTAPQGTSLGPAAMSQSTPVSPPVVPTPPVVAQLVVPQPVAPPHVALSYPLARTRPPAPPANDDWFVRVRGMHSASLRKHHVKNLYQAREITLDCLARHASWHDNDWRPIHSIPQLADITRP